MTKAREQERIRTEKRFFEMQRKKIELENQLNTERRDVEKMKDEMAKALAAVQSAK